MDQSSASSGRPKRPRIQAKKNHSTRRSDTAKFGSAKRESRSDSGPRERNFDNDRISRPRAFSSRSGNEGSRDGNAFGKSNSPKSEFQPRTDRNRISDRPFSGNKKSGFDSREKYVKGDRPGYQGHDRNRDEDRRRNFIQKRKLEKIQQDIFKDTIRLNKFVANSGICSRREADDLIKQGLVEVNGKPVTEMGYQVQKTDRVIFDGQPLSAEKPVYILLNKPKGYISTTKDEKARKTVMDLVANASPYRVFPVGRLDRSTTGVILLTNDGHLTKKLTHPSFDIKKIYHVTLDRKVSADDLQTLSDGVRLEEGVAKADSISYIEGKPKNEVGIEIHIGWNRVVRRMFQKLGYEVEALDRVMFAGLTKKNIKRGHWRILTELEANNLKMM